jgi:DNA-binding CsgD family transcriptional regulator
MNPNPTTLEKEIIALIADGKSTKEISAITKYTHTSIETYRSKMIRKFGAVNTPHLVALAFQYGILTLNKPL